MARTPHQNRMVINDEESGLHVDVSLSDDLPEDVVARRMLGFLEMVEYHHFQNESEVDE